MTSLSPQRHALTDEPKWSSAALCIKLSHLGQNFRPEYVHQLVESECWRGHRPLESVLRTATSEYKSSISTGSDESIALSVPTSTGILHKSHENHDAVASQLEIRVVISPSCQQCCVDVTRVESKRGEHGDVDEGEPTAKRRRTDLDSEFQQQIVSSSGGTSSETNEQDRKRPLSSSESISLLPMKDSEIMSGLCKALPPIIPRDDNSCKVEDCFLSEPVGDVLNEYSIPATQTSGNNLSASDSTENDKRSSSKRFVITIADGRSSNVAEYHGSVQNLALFYIENADNVDVANDSDGGFWKIMYIFQKHYDDDKKEEKPFKYSLVGYFTLFHFIALFHKTRPGVILRICQALILPPFQGEGHGRRLLQMVHNLAHKDSGEKISSDNIVQVNVEDPSPAFVALRNKMDLQLVLQYYDEWNWLEKGSMWSSGLSKSLAPKDKLALFFSSMTEKEASDMSIKAKITPKQINIANELLKLKAIRATAGHPLEKINNEDKDTIEKLFRLMVKRRLNKEHRDDLLEQPTKDDQKAMLAKLFNKELKGYERIISRLSS